MKISLVYMPFAPVEAPSIGLAQIESVLRHRFGDGIDLGLHYLNIDFAEMFMGSGFYAQMVSPYARISGVADWFFRSVAFPEAMDNADAYLDRYYFDDTPATTCVAGAVRKFRPQLIRLLDELVERYDLASSDVVGFSLNFFQTTASIAMANRLKAVNPGVKVVFGGPSVRGLPGQTFAERIPSVDYVCSGPGLVSFPALISCMLSGEEEMISRIQGVFPMGSENYTGPDCAVGKNLDIDREIPLDYTPFLDKFEALLGDTSVAPYLLMQTSRGCWWADRQRCTFCGLNCLCEKFEAMSPAVALSHLHAVLRYSDRVAYFAACDNMAPPQYFETVFPFLEIPRGALIKYEIRPDISAEEIQVLCNAGIRCVQPGVEALSTATLRLMRKGVSAFSNIRFLKDCTRIGLFAEWNILLFSPGEDEDVYRKYEEDFPRLAHLQPPTGVFPVEYVRDSCYFQHPDQFGLDLIPHESLFYIYPFDCQTIASLACRFADRNADAARMDYWLDRLGEVVAEWRRRWSVVPDERPRLVLWRDEYGAVVYDSRLHDAESYRISDLEERFLREMDRHPVSAEEVAALCGIEMPLAGEVLESLQTRNLLFCENDKYLSLAVSAE